MSLLCSVTGCIYPRDGKQLACRRHWERVPEELRRELLRLARKAPGTPAHVKAWEVTMRVLSEMSLEGGADAR